MGNDIFTSKMQRNKLFFLMHEVQLFGTKFIFIAAFLQTVSLHRDQMLFVTYFYCDIFFHKHFWSKKLERERERFITSEIQCFRRSELPFKTVSMFQMKHSKWVQSLYTQLYQFMIRSNWGLLLILILIFFFWFVRWSFAFFFFFLRSIFLLV